MTALEYEILEAKYKVYAIILNAYFYTVMKTTFTLADIVLQKIYSRLIVDTALKGLGN